MKNKRLTLLVCITLALLGYNTSQAQEDKSGLGKHDFSKYWMIESESPEYSIKHLGDTLELVAPKGLTLWRKAKMEGNVVIEYDACVMDEGRPEDRLSDLNCFWMASDPKHPTDIKKRMDWRNGIFLRSYTLQLYYVGFGGNHNTTTRFRRYNADEEGVTDKSKRPAILREYTDEAHLLKPNKWYHIRLESLNGRVTYTIDGEKLVDFLDANPLNEGWFGFRTTLSRTRIANFSYSCTPIEKQPKDISLCWIGETPETDTPNSWGVPFEPGSVMPHTPFMLTSKGNLLEYDFWPLAYWSDGSVKWGGFSTVVPGGTDTLCLSIDYKRNAAKGTKKKIQHNKPEGEAGKEKNQNSKFNVTTGSLTAYFTPTGESLFDSLSCNGVKVAGKARLICRTRENFFSDKGEESFRQKRFDNRITACNIEQSNKVRTVVKIEGMHTDGEREWLPFVVRLYFYKGSEQIKMVHTLLFDGDAEKDFINSVGITVDIPLRDEPYNRYVTFGNTEGKIWSEAVQPLVGRRLLNLNGKPMQPLQTRGERVPAPEKFDKRGQALIADWAAWDGYRLSQTGPDGYTLRKRATSCSPWIGTIGGKRANGFVGASDTQGGIAACLHDFWQSYPSTLELNGMRSDNATLSIWLWSPEAEPMDLRHYDTVAHGLNAAYEDVQEGLSTPYGIARTSVITLTPYTYKGTEHTAHVAKAIGKEHQLACTPTYLHDRKAFGVWSLPTKDTPLTQEIEAQLDSYIDHYQKEIEQHRWYGFWNYGDVMHTYDPVRQCWLYDVGGFAWDNTELASNMWLWYMFLRSGREDIWQMAKAMSRHTGEVDVYHMGSLAGLGTRHNVSHWGCGAKEARISQAAWNRFYYYLTTDERTGDLMTEVKDADLLLYDLDPMRLAQPRHLYPCTAPARLRIGPDWLAYVGNWMTQWERTGDTTYRDKILAGMESIAKLPNGIFTGPKALGYDPATGIITYEGDTTIQNTNHLLPLMGGFEVVNELNRMLPHNDWQRVWLEHARDYRQKSIDISGSRFRISRLGAYAAYHLYDPEAAKTAWQELLPPIPTNRIGTNGVATWSLDAIYLMEVIKR